MPIERHSLAFVAFATLVGLAAAGCSESVNCVPQGFTSTVALSDEHSYLMCTDGFVFVKTAVEAGRFYTLLIDVAGGTLGNTRVPIDIGGSALDTPVHYDLEKLAALGGVQAIGFLPDREGEILVSILNRSEDSAQPSGPTLLFGNQRNITARLQVVAEQLEDHGETPDEATRLIPDGSFVEGVLAYGDEYDYFLVELRKGQSYRITAETTGNVTFDTSNVDRFGQFNPHVPTFGGLSLALTPERGKPTTVTVIAPADENALFSVSPGFHPQILDIIEGKEEPVYEDFPISYAVSVESLSEPVLTCDELGPPPNIDWSTIEERAEIVFDVTCTDLPDDELKTRYTTESTDAMVRVLPTETRYMLLTDTANRVQHIFLAGTNFANLQEVLYDLDDTPVFDEGLGAIFHTGFLAAARQVQFDVLPLLDPTYTTRLTGYSLGGATAAILAMELQLGGYAVDSVLTFGQPKVTDQAGASKFSGQPIFRVVAGYDGITHVYAENFQHFGPQVILLDGERIVYIDQTDRNYDASTDPELFGSDFSDHTTYLTRIPPKLAGTTLTSLCDIDKYVTPQAQLVCR